jgi:hypothetical protein
METTGGSIALYDLITVTLAAWGLAFVLTPILPRSTEWCEIPFHVSKSEVHVVAGYCQPKLSY